MTPVARPAVDDGADAHVADARQPVAVAHVGARALAGRAVVLPVAGRARAGDAAVVTMLRLVAAVAVIARLAVVHAGEGRVV